MVKVISGSFRHPLILQYFLSECANSSYQWEIISFQRAGKEIDEVSLGYLNFLSVIWKQEEQAEKKKGACAMYVLGPEDCFEVGNVL